MWLIRDDVAQAIAKAKNSGLSFTPEQCAEMLTRRARAQEEGGGNPALTIAGDLAEIRIEGALTPQPDIFAWLFGGGNTTYADIIEALAVAAADPNVKRVSMLVNSPGGTVAGLFDTLAAIQALGKPIKVLAAQACSAAYAIASVAGPIEATNAAAEFGSIGVAIRMYAPDDVVELASTEAPKKRPDPKTEEGKATIREYLDAIHALFADAIAHGRGVDRNTVNSEFGRGAVLLAGEAKRLGMIDKIQKPALRPVSRRAAAEGDDSEDITMDLHTLKTKHPELYNAVVLEGRSMGPVAAPPAAAPVPAIAPGGGAGAERPMDLKQLKAQHPDAYEAAVADGVAQERKRVKAHLNMGESCGDLKIAITAIREGEAHDDPEAVSRYFAAGMNRSDKRARQQETDTAGAAADGASAPASAAEDISDQVASLVESLTGTGKKKAS